MLLESSFVARFSRWFPSDVRGDGSVLGKPEEQEADTYSEVPPLCREQSEEKQTCFVWEGVNLERPKCDQEPSRPELAELTAACKKRVRPSTPPPPHTQYFISSLGSVEAPREVYDVSFWK